MEKRPQKTNRRNAENSRARPEFDLQKALRFMWRIALFAVLLCFLIWRIVSCGK